MLLNQRREQARPAALQLDRDVYLMAASSKLLQDGLEITRKFGVSQEDEDLHRSVCVVGQANASRACSERCASASDASTANRRTISASGDTKVK